jgi:hypothetical protein
LYGNVPSDVINVYQPPGTNVYITFKSPWMRGRFTIGVQLIELVKKGPINRLHSFRKSADFCLEEKSAGAVFVYEQKRLADLSSLGVKLADMDRNIKGTVLQG